MAGGFLREMTKILIGLKLNSRNSSAGRAGVL